ncbi:nucleotidyltransferase family protein [Herbaspirillum sp. RV1423]|uniref:nucleotidyltransferase family protein n=1 Tax=Herbaspirillum sp. RV1423 TaxID=1443993 RepID=UPI0009DE5FFB|nr:nucleotidyltransferase family protein [Herbaspirillum sp. RV1423]
MFSRHPVNYLSDLKELILADQHRMHILKIVYQLSLPDCWIGAGFVRDAVWDHIHGMVPRSPEGDIDVIFFDSSNVDKNREIFIESLLSNLDGTWRWSVKNQARMHVGNSDLPYASSADALRFWPDTATAVGIRYSNSDGIEVLAPYFLEDLFEARLTPTPRFKSEKKHIFDERIRSKRWLDKWPKLRINI